MYMCIFIIYDFLNKKIAALNTKHKTQMHWHPLFIKWCLNISRVSPKAYDILRESGIQLPTHCILNDYTHSMSAKPGSRH